MATRVEDIFRTDMGRTELPGTEISVFQLSDYVSRTLTTDSSTGTVWVSGFAPSFVRATVAGVPDEPLIDLLSHAKSVVHGLGFLPISEDDQNAVDELLLAKRKDRVCRTL